MEQENAEVERFAPGSSALEALNTSAREHVDGNVPPNTKRSYDGDRAKWREYCAEFGIPETTLSIGTMLGFVEWLINKGLAPSTIERRASGARMSLLSEHGLPDLDKPDRKRITKRIDQYKRHLAETGERRGRGKAKAVTLKDLRAISTALPDTLIGTRDRALLLLGFALGARRSELAGLWAADVEQRDEGLRVTIRSSKTSDEEVTVAVPYGTSDLTCPVRAWQRYRAAVEDATGEALTGKAFRRIDRHGRVLGEMSPQGVGIAFNRAARNAGIDGDRVTTHGLRAGFATEARRAGHDAKTISEHGRWKPTSPILYGYFRQADQWEDNALKGIGL